MWCLTISIPADGTLLPGSVPIHLMTPYQGAESGLSTWIQSPTSKASLLELQLFEVDWGELAPAVAALGDVSGELIGLSLVLLSIELRLSGSGLDLSDVLDANLFRSCLRTKSLSVGGADEAGFVEGWLVDVGVGAGGLTGLSV